MPREGTKTPVMRFGSNLSGTLRLDMPREGTKTVFRRMKNHSADLLRLDMPREGTKTLRIALLQRKSLLRLDMPREGTKTKILPRDKNSLFIEIRYAPGGDENVIAFSVSALCFLN